MKPSELYAREPQEVLDDVHVLNGCYYKHVPELDDVWHQVDLAKNTRVKIRAYKHVNYDGTHFWLLGAVYLDDRPVMVIRNAGREGDDFHSRFVTDMAAYGDMVRYLATLFKGPDQELTPEIVSADEDIYKLEEFYGDSLLYDGRA